MKPGYQFNHIINFSTLHRRLQPLRYILSKLWTKGGNLDTICSLKSCRLIFFFWGGDSFVWRQYHYCPLHSLTADAIRSRWAFGLFPESRADFSDTGSSLSDFCSIMTIRFPSNKANQKIQSIAPHLICILIRCLCRASYLSKSRYSSSLETVIASIDFSSRSMDLICNNWRNVEAL